MDYRLALMCGVDLPLPALQLLLHQPTLKEIALIGEEDFFLGLQSLCVNKDMLSQGELVLSDINNFQIFMMVMNDKSSGSKKSAVRQVLTLLFPECQSMLTPQSLLLRKGEDTIMIDENNFDELQSILKKVFCLNRSNDNMPVYNPKGKKAKEIADKIMRGRAKVAQIKGLDKESAFVKYISILTVGLKSMSLQEITNLTMFQLYDLVERYQLYTAWDIDIRAKMAGAKSDSPPENWMKSLYKD